MFVAIGLTTAAFFGRSIGGFHEGQQSTLPLAGARGPLSRVPATGRRRRLQRLPRSVKKSCRMLSFSGITTYQRTVCRHRTGTDTAIAPGCVKEGMRQQATLERPFRSTALACIPATRFAPISIRRRSTTAWSSCGESTRTGRSRPARVRLHLRLRDDPQARRRLDRHGRARPGGGGGPGPRQLPHRDRGARGADRRRLGPPLRAPLPRRRIRAAGRPRPSRSSSTQSVEVVARRPPGILRAGRPGPDHHLRDRLSASDRGPPGDDLHAAARRVRRAHRAGADVRLRAPRSRQLRSRGLARGGSLHNAVVLDDTGILSGPLRFRDEFVRHKVLDLIGDLAAARAAAPRPHPRAQGRPRAPHRVRPRPPRRHPRTRRSSRPDDAEADRFRASGPHAGLSGPPAPHSSQQLRLEHLLRAKTLRAGGSARPRRRAPRPASGPRSPSRRSATPCRSASERTHSKTRWSGVFLKFVMLIETWTIPRSRELDAHRLDVPEAAGEMADRLGDAIGDREVLRARG